MDQCNGVSKLRPSRVTEEYGVPEQTLANWRCQGRGPSYVRVSARLIYYDRNDLERRFPARLLVPFAESNGMPSARSTGYV